LGNPANQKYSQDDIDDFYLFMISQYQHAFKQTYGNGADGQWANVLKDLERDEIKSGIEQIRAINKQENPHPPTPEQFRAMCRPPRKANESFGMRELKREIADAEINRVCRSQHEKIRMQLRCAVVCALSGDKKTARLYIDSIYSDLLMAIIGD
jgi:hypothetical protein